MLKSISKLGTSLTRGQQKGIIAGVTHTYNLDDYDVEIMGDFPGPATCYCDGFQQPCDLHC